MLELFQTAIFWIESSKYVLLFIGCIFEGPVAMIAAGFLFGLGQFELLPMYTALVLGDFTADIFWYCLGRFGTRSTIFKYGHIINLTPAILEKVENRFLRYHEKILVISKITMGLGFAIVVLIVAGIFKVPFKNYVVLNLIGGFIWTALLVMVGYFFGNIYLVIPSSAKIIFTFSMLIIIIASLRQINNYLKTVEI